MDRFPLSGRARAVANVLFKRRIADIVASEISGFDSDVVAAVNAAIIENGKISLTSKKLMLKNATSSRFVAPKASGDPGYIAVTSEQTEED